MAHKNSHSRTSAALHPNIAMDPTRRRHPKPTPFIAPAPTSAVKSHHHSTPDSTITPSSSIETISHRFSKLYANNKKFAFNSTNPLIFHLNPQPEARFHEKTVVGSPVLDASCTALTKSKSINHGRNDFVASKVEKKERFISSRTQMKEKDELKKSMEKVPKKPSLMEHDVRKASQLMSRSLESDQVKGFQKGFQGRRSSMPIISLPLDTGTRRRSLCSSYVELADVLSCSGVKVVTVDMPPFMQIHAVNCARKTHDSLEKFTSKTLAYTLKKEFDEAYGPAWHCIVGTSFGSFVTHSVGGFMYFSMDHKIYVLLFKTAVQKADPN